jgi:hypothetical protein
MQLIKTAVTHVPSALAGLILKRQELLVRFLRDGNLHNFNIEMYQGVISGNPARQANPFPSQSHTPGGGLMGLGYHPPLAGSLPTGMNNSLCSLLREKISQVLLYIQLNEARDALGLELWPRLDHTFL